MQNQVNGVTGQAFLDIYGEPLCVIDAEQSEYTGKMD